MRETMLNRRHLYPVGDDKIFIGNGLGLPVVGKLYCRKKAYDKMLRQIRSKVELIEWMSCSEQLNLKQFMVQSGAYVTIEEHSNSVFMQVSFSNSSGSYGFEGLTNQKGDGFYQFMRAFNDVKQLLIILMCEETKEQTQICVIASTGEVTIKPLYCYNL